MLYNENIRGKYIDLKSVTSKDAAFTSKLRSDEKMIQYVHKVDSSIKGQIDYIMEQNNRIDDYYFVIWSKEYKPLGTIALYHLKDIEGEVGRWISYGNAAENLESVILIHDLAFEKMHLQKVFTCTDVRNERVKSFWRNFGCDENYVEKIQDDFIASKNIVTLGTYFEKIRPKMSRLLHY